MAAIAVNSRRIIPVTGLKMAALERDAGFCSGEDEEHDHELEVEDMHSPTDASEDSVEVRVQPVASKSKRKCAEPRRFECAEPKRRLIDFSDADCGPFRPWSQVQVQPPSGYTQEEPLSLVLREKTPERLSPLTATALGSRPRPRDVVRLRPSATVVRSRDALRTPSAPPQTVRSHERLVRIPSVISIKPEFTDRSIHVHPALLRSEEFERIPVPHPTFSIRPEEHETALRVPPVTRVKLEEIERIPRAPVATATPEESERFLRFPSVSSACLEDLERVRLSSRTSFGAEERDRREEADRVRPDECDKRAFSVESLMGGPSTSKGKSTSPAVAAAAHQQQRNYKNMTRERRIEANARERTRVHTISAAFDTLRRAVPAYSHNQKLSKLSVLRIACSYILTLSRVAGDDYSADQSRPDLSDCVDNVSRTIQMEGKLRKKRDE